MNKHVVSADFQSRRDFLQSAAAAGGVLIFSPMISAQKESQDKHDEINIALIGAGAQGQVLMNACRNIPGIRFKALCDIWANFNRKRAARILEAYGHKVNQYENYQQMLSDEKDLDAVIIATPDFCHAEQTIACLEAGLHVYCEKEMSNTLEGARKMVQAAKHTGKLLQIGRQRRSNPRYVHCYETLMKEYELFGQIKAVNGQWNRPLYEPLGWADNYALSQETLNKYGYKSMEQFRNWRWYKNLGGGRIVDLGSHQIDIYNWFLEATPKSITASGCKNYNKKYGFEWYDTTMMLIEYETSHDLVSAFYQTIPFNTDSTQFEKFIGEHGTVLISEYNSNDMIYPERSRINSESWLKCIQNGDLVFSEETKNELDRTPELFPSIFTVDESADPIKNGRYLNLPVPNPVKPYHQSHLENFFDAIRGKTQLNCPAEIGYKTAAVVLKINEAIESGQKIQFEPDDFIV